MQRLYAGCSTGYLTPPETSRDRLRRLGFACALWPYWIGLGLAFVVLERRLAAAGEATLQFWFNSDYLFAADAYKDIFIDKFPLSGIKFSIAPFFFPDLVFTSLLMFLTGNAILATFLYGLLQFTLVVGAYLFCASVVEPRRRPPSACILLVAIGLVLYTASIVQLPYHTLYYLFLSECHVGCFALTVFCGGAGVWLCFHPLRGRRAIATLAALALLSMLGTLSDLLFIPHMLAPFTTAVLIMSYLNLLPARRPWVVLAGVGGSSLLGLILVRASFDSAKLGTETGLAVDRFTTALNVYLRGAYSRLSSGDWLHAMALCWLIAALTLTLYLVRRHVILRDTFGDMVQPTRRLLLTVLFLFFSAVSSTLTIIVQGVAGLSELKDHIWSMHYQYPLFFGAPFALALLAGVAIVRLPAVSRRSLRLLPACAAVIAPGGMFLLSPGSPLSLRAYKPPLVRALDALGPRYGLHYGVGGFWQSRWVNMLSTTDLRLYPVDANLEPYHWLSNIYWYSGYPDSKYPHPAYDFALLDAAASKTGRQILMTRFGEPAAEEVLPDDMRILIYNRPSDTRFRDLFACSAVLASVLHPLHKTGDRVEHSGSCLPGSVGAVEGQVRAARQGREGKGFLSYGPYFALTSGSYLATLQCHVDGPAAQPEGSWDLGYFDRDPKIRITGGELRTGQSDVRAEFTVSSANAGRPLEMRVVYNGIGDVIVDKIRIERTQ